MTVRTFALLQAPFPLVKVSIAVHLVLLVVGVVDFIAHLVVVVVIVVIVVVVVVVVLVVVAVVVVVVVVVVADDDVVTRGRNGPFPLLIFHHGIPRELEVNLVKKIKNIKLFSKIDEDGKLMYIERIITTQKTPLSYLALF